MIDPTPTSTAVVQLVLAGPTTTPVVTPIWQILVVVVPVVVNSLLAWGFAWWATRQKTKMDVSIEELKAQLASLGSEQHLSFQTFYGKQCSAAEILMAKHYEIFMALLHLTTTRDAPLSPPFTLEEMTTILKTTVQDALQIGQTYLLESFLNQRAWLDDESDKACRQVISKLGTLRTKLSGVEETTSWEATKTLAVAAETEIGAVHDAIKDADRALKTMISPTAAPAPHPDAPDSP